MATNIIAGSRYKAPYAGDAGNSLVLSGYHKMAAAGAIGDTIELLEIPAGAKVDEICEAHSAHGGTATLAFGWKYKDGSAGGSATAVKAAASTVAAGDSQKTLFPEGVITGGVFDKPAILYATNAGSAIPQNGEIYVKLKGEFLGTK